MKKFALSALALILCVLIGTQTSLAQISAEPREVVDDTQKFAGFAGKVTGQWPDWVGDKIATNDNGRIKVFYKSGTVKDFGPGQVPRLSQDGKFLAFVQRETAAIRYLRIVNLETDQVSTVFASTSLHLDSQLVWDGNNVFFTRVVQNPTTQVYEMNIWVVNVTTFAFERVTRFTQEGGSVDPEYRGGPFLFVGKADKLKNNDDGGWMNNVAIWAGINGEIMFEGSSGVRRFLRLDPVKGRHLLFKEDYCHSGWGGIALLDTFTGIKRRLFDLEAHSACWGPDGKTIAVSIGNVIKFYQVL